MNFLPFKVVPGKYSVTDLAFWPLPGRDDQPSFQSYIPDVPIFWQNWQRGYGALYYDPVNAQNDTSQFYQIANGIDAAVQSQMTLATGFATVGISGTNGISENILQWPEFVGTLMPTGSSNVYVWTPSGSPNGLSVNLPAASAAGPIGKSAIFTIGAGASTAARPAGPYLYVPTGSSFWVASASAAAASNSSAWPSCWTRVASPAAHFEVVNRNLWVVFYDSVNRVWSVSQSSDGSTWSTANTFQLASGTATATWTLDYDNRLDLFTTRGMATLDGSANPIDLIPEIGRYGDPHVGVGADTFSGYAYIPSAYGLMQFEGSNVVNPQTSQAARSIGPDQNSWGQSNLRGTFQGVAPHINYLYGGQNSDAGTGFILKYHPLPTLNPGEGWHPIIQFANAKVGVPKVSGLPWYGTSYPILWMSAGSGAAFNIYQARLPNNTDNPLLDTNVGFQPTGTLDLPIIDDNMPEIAKTWVKYVADLSAPTGTTVQILAAIDGTVYSQVGGLVTGTTGVVEFVFGTNGTNGYKLQTRIQMTSSTTAVTASQTPVLRSLTLHHFQRPVRRRQWSFDAVAEDFATNMDQSTAAQKIRQIDTDRRIVGPIIFQDLIGDGALVTVQKFDYQQAERRQGTGVQWLASVELQDFSAADLGFFTMSAYTMYSWASYAPH